MLKWRPPVVYKYLWKYVCLLAMIGLLAASLLRMVFKRPTYTAWNESTVRRVLWVKRGHMLKTRCGAKYIVIISFG